MNSNKNKWILTFHYLIPSLFYCMLVYVYVQYTSVTWNYLGHQSDFSFERFILGFMCLVVVRFMTPTRLDTFRDFVLVFFASINMLGMIVLYAARGYDSIYFVSTILFFVTVAFVSGRWSFNIKQRKTTDKIPVVLCVLGVFISVFWIVINGGLGQLNFNLQEIYNVRTESMSRYFGGVFGYLNNWSIKVFLPALLALGIMRRSWVLIILAIAVTALFYAAYAQKAPVGVAIFIVFSLWAVPKSIPSYVIEVLFFILALVGLVLFHFESLKVMALVLNRIYFNPAVNNISYFEYISNNQFVYFSNTFLSKFVQYPYEARVSEIVSLLRTGRFGVNANTGVLGTGYMQLGYLGLLLYSLIVGAIIGFIQDLSRQHFQWIPISLAAPSMFLLFTSTDLSVAFFTGGLWLAIVLLFLWPKS